MDGLCRYEYTFSRAVWATWGDAPWNGKAA
jgi:hypothetical protein